MSSLPHWGRAQLQAAYGTYFKLCLMIKMSDIFLRLFFVICFLYAAKIASVPPLWVIFLTLQTMITFSPFKKDVLIKFVWSVLCFILITYN